VIGVYQQEGLNLFDLVKKVVKEQLDFDSYSAGYFEVPTESFNPLRRQYNSSAIMKQLTEKTDNKADYKIGIVNVDVYTQGMNFIFGMADPPKKTAFVSIYRLTREKREERISKEIVHELGHLLGLTHCADPNCVMYFSKTISDTDNKSINMCSNCRGKIE
jgi:archaemetzincin